MIFLLIFFLNFIKFLRNLSKNSLFYSNKIRDLSNTFESIFSIFFCRFLINLLNAMFRTSLIFLSKEIYRPVESALISFKTCLRFSILFKVSNALKNSSLISKFSSIKKFKVLSSMLQSVIIYFNISCFSLLSFYSVLI